MVAALCAAAFAWELPSAWRAWRYSRAIDSQHAGTLSYITLDRQVFVHSENRLADLRVIDDLGTELPYELRNRLAPPARPLNVPATLRENSFVPGQFTQVIADLVHRPNFHNTVPVQTAASDFINWGELAASAPARVGRMVQPHC